jgi:hypothetical protein
MVRGGATSRGIEASVTVVASEEASLDAGAGL